MDAAQCDFLRDAHEQAALEDVHQLRLYPDQKAVERQQGESWVDFWQACQSAAV
jgi:hypothetical protein